MRKNIRRNHLWRECLLGTTRVTRVEGNAETGSYKYVVKTTCAKNNNSIIGYIRLEKPVTYTVTFDANGGSVSPTTKSFPVGSLIGELPTPTRNGYVFSGWSTAKEGSGMIVTPGSLTMLEDITLYAVWRSQTVTFDANGGSTPQSVKLVTIGSAYGDLPVPTRTGCSFDGWYTSTSGGTQITPVQRLPR